MSFDAYIRELDKGKDEPCSGLVFRYRENTFWDSLRNSLSIRKSLTLLKKRSCTCTTCLYNLDYMTEMVDIDGIIYPNDVKDFDLCTLHIVNQSTDWESGIADSWDYEFRVIKDEATVKNENQDI